MVLDQGCPNGTSERFRTGNDALEPWIINAIEVTRRAISAALVTATPRQGPESESMRQDTHLLALLFPRALRLVLVYQELECDDPVQYAAYHIRHHEGEISRFLYRGEYPDRRTGELHPTGRE